MSGYFYGPPPTFIGGRQPYAPKLGLAQSGPDAVASQVPINRASLAIVDAAWRAENLPHIRGEYFAPTLPIISQPPPISRAALWNIDAKWREDIITVISLSSLAPQGEAETADAPPVRDGQNLNLVLRAWEPRARHPQASPKGIISGPLADAAPLIYRANFSAIIEQWKPKPYAPPKLIGIGAVFQAADTTPDQFSFTDQSGVAQSSTITSDPVTITGINDAADITVSGGTYSISGGAFTALAGTVVNGDAVRARHTSSASYLTATNTVVTIGGVSDTFRSITEGDPAQAAYMERPFSLNWWSHQ